MLALNVVSEICSQIAGSERCVFERYDQAYELVSEICERKFIGNAEGNWVLQDLFDQIISAAPS